MSLLPLLPLSVNKDVEDNCINVDAASIAQSWLLLLEFEDKLEESVQEEMW